MGVVFVYIFNNNNLHFCKTVFMAIYCLRVFKFCNQGFVQAQNFYFVVVFCILRVRVEFYCAELRVLRINTKYSQQNCESEVQYCIADRNKVFWNGIALQFSYDTSARFVAHNPQQMRNTPTQHA